MSVEEINEIKKTLRLNFFKLVEKMSKMTNTKLKSIFNDYVSELDHKYYNISVSPNCILKDAYWGIKGVLENDNVVKYLETNQSTNFDNHYKRFNCIFYNNVKSEGNLNYEELNQINNYLIDLVK